MTNKMKFSKSHRLGLESIYFSIVDQVDDQTEFTKDGEPMDGYCTMLECSMDDGAGSSAVISGFIDEKSAKQLAEFFNKISFQLEERHKRCLKELNTSEKKRKKMTV